MIESNKSNRSNQKRKFAVFTYHDKEFHIYIYFSNQDLVEFNAYKL